MASGPSGGDAPRRTQRADAVRNRAKILRAARELITSAGSEVGMDRIAKEGGVAVGTLYGHFPTKTDLVAAAVGEFTIRVADDAEAARARVEAGASPLQEIIGFLAGVIEESASNYAIKAAALGLGVPHHGDEAAENRAGRAVAAMITAGQQASEVQPDLTVEDVYLLMSTAPTDQPKSDRDRWLALVVSGLQRREV